MNYMVIHEELKRGGLRTIVPDLPQCGANGVKIETRKRSAERNIRKYLAKLAASGKNLPQDRNKTVRLKRTVRRCHIHFVQVNGLEQLAIKRMDLEQANLDLVSVLR